MLLRLRKLFFQNSIAAPLRNAIHIGMEQYVGTTSGNRRLDDFEFLNVSATSMIGDLIWWMRALGAARQEQPMRHEQVE